MIIRSEKRNKYFLILEKFYSEKQWVSAACVRPGSPASNLAARIYSCFFHGTKDVNEDYNKYYVKEYSSLWAYLYWYYMIEDDVIEQIKAIYKEPQRIFYGDVHSGGDYMLGDYVMDEHEGFPMVQSILETLRRKHKK